MPLAPCDPATGASTPQAEWTMEDRRKWIEQVIREQKDNANYSLPVDGTAFDKAAKLADGDSVLLTSIQDARLTTDAMAGRVQPAGRTRVSG